MGREVSDQLLLALQEGVSQPRGKTPFPRLGHGSCLNRTLRHLPMAGRFPENSTRATPTRHPLFDFSCEYQSREPRIVPASHCGLGWQTLFRLTNTVLEMQACSQICKGQLGTDNEGNRRRKEG